MLKKYGIPQWQEWLEKDKRLIENSDSYGIEHLLSAFGGMGSFNDLYICRENGHMIKENETDSVNRQLNVLREQLLKLATAIREEVSIK